MGVSIPPPPDEPTRPLTPAQPIPERERVHEREYVAAADDPRLDLLLDRVRSLRTAVALLGLVSLAALALGAYLLLTKEEEGDTRAGASRGSVASLEDRVDDLESDLRSRATKDDLDQVSEDQEALSDRIDDVAKRAKPADDAGADDELQSSIDRLDQNQQTLGDSIEKLDQRVADLEQEQQQQP